MIASTALLLALLAAAPAPAGRALLCRTRVIAGAGEPRGGAVAEAARTLPGRFLDYGVVCEDVAEAVRAARRAGLERALTSTVERQGAAARYVLALADAALAREIARREVTVARGQDAVAPLRQALRELLSARADEPEGAGAAAPRPGAPPRAGSPPSRFSESISRPGSGSP